jgi:hypothetical protein
MTIEESKKRMDDIDQLLSSGRTEDALVDELELLREFVGWIAAGGRKDRYEIAKLLAGV